MPVRWDISVRRRRRRGAVLIVVLVALTLLVGLIFFVFNLGDQLNRRVGQQNAADAVAISGAGWLARTMNVVAMDNVTMSRLIALDAILDSLPLAAEMTIAEETGENRLPDALEPWKDVGAAFTDYERDNFFREGLAELYTQMSEENDDRTSHLELLQQIDAAFDQSDELETEGGYDVAPTTEWDGPNGRGSLWRAMLAMDEFSTAAVESAGELAQSNAIRYGEQDRARVALLVPIIPRVPAERTHFDSFSSVFDEHIRYGTDQNTQAEVREVESTNLVSTLAAAEDTASAARQIRTRGGAIPDVTFDYRLGPFAKLYRWRDYWDQYDSSGYSVQYVERWGYTTYGPLENALRRVVDGFGLAGSEAGTLDTSRFTAHLRMLAQVKVAYMLGLESPILVQYSDEWIADYEEAKEFAEEDAAAVRSGAKPYTDVMTTRYYRVHVKSTVNWDSSDWMRLAAWEEDAPTATFTPRRWYSYQLSGRGPYSDPTQQPLYRWILDQTGWHDIGNAVSYGGASGASAPQGRWIEAESGGRVWYRKDRQRRCGLRPRTGLAGTHHDRRERGDGDRALHDLPLRDPLLRRAGGPQHDPPVEPHCRRRPGRLAGSDAAGYVQRRLQRGRPGPRHGRPAVAVQYPGRYGAVGVVARLAAAVQHRQPLRRRDGDGPGGNLQQPELGSLDPDLASPTRARLTMGRLAPAAGLRQ